MSWSLTHPALDSVPADEALAKIDEVAGVSLPLSIRAYLHDAITGLQTYHDDPKLLISIHGYGHLCAGKGSYDVSSALVEVRRAESA